MRNRAAGLLLLAALGVGNAAMAQSGGGYDLSWNTVDGGGVTFATGGGYTLGATAGQPDAGNHAGGAYTHSGGFWYAPTALFTVVKDYNDNNPAPVTVTLSCSNGVVSPATALASEAVPASFTVSGFIGAPTCTATEVVPVNYTANQAGCANVALAAGTCTIINTLNLADLSVTLTDTPDPVTAGANLTYVATLTNAGPNDALGANLTLPLPTPLTFVSLVASPGGVCTDPGVGANGSVVCTWAGATLPGAGNARSVTVVAAVPASTLGGTLLSATATVASTTADPGPAPNTATATTTVNASADLTATLADAPDPVTAGTQLTYTGVLTNAGPSDAQDASLSLPLPAGTSFVSAMASAGGSCNATSPVVCTWSGATLPAGTRTATIVALVSAAQTANLSATITAASLTTDPVANNTATATTTVATAADLSITLTDAPDPVIAGSNLTYVATLTNNGPSDAQGANISLPLPATTTFVSVVPSAAGACTSPAVGTNGTVVCTWVGATAPGAGNARSVTVVAAVPAATANGTVLSATATAASTTSDPGPAANTATTTTTVATAADLSITLTDAPDPVIAGSNLTYVATLTNNGPSDAQGANITLPLPATTTFVSVVPSAAGACTSPAVGANGTIVCTWAGATAPGAGNARSVTVVAAVPAATANGTVLSATATAASTTSDPGPAANTATATTTVAAAADLSITLTDAPDPVVAGSTLTYVATLTNNGPSDAQGANISLPLPATTTFVSVAASAPGSCTSPAVGANGTVVCTWAGATASGAGNARSFTLIVAVPAATANGAVLSATATAASATNDPGPSANAATATTAVIANADLAITLTDAPDPVVAGANLTYTASVSNAGPSDATGVTITLPLPAGTSLVSGSISGGGACAGSPVVCTVIGNIAPGGVRAATIVVAVAPSVVSGTTLTATATVAATSTDPNLTNNSASTPTAVIASADLQIGLTASASQAIVNVPVTFTVTSLNLGPSDAQSVAITLTLTPDFRYSTHTATGATCSTPQVGTTGAIVCTWAGATAPGTTRTLSVVACSTVEGLTAVNASTTSTTPDPVANNNLASLSVQIGYLVEEIPALGAIGLLLLSLLIGAAGVVATRRDA